MKTQPEPEITAAEQADILDSLDPEKNYLDRAELLKSDSEFDDLPDPISAPFRRKPRPKSF